VPDTKNQRLTVRAFVWPLQEIFEKKAESLFEHSRRKDDQDADGQHPVLVCRQEGDDARGVLHLGEQLDPEQDL